MRNLYLIMGIFVFFTAAAALVGSFYIYRDAEHFINTGIQTNAVIISIKTHGTGEDRDTDVIVEYVINGVEYRTELDQYTHKMQVGQTLPIRYLPENPIKIAYAKNEYSLFYMFLVGGIISILISAALLSVYIYQIKHNKEQVL